MNTMQRKITAAALKLKLPARFYRPNEQNNPTVRPVSHRKVAVSDTSTPTAENKPRKCGLARYQPNFMLSESQRNTAKVQLSSFFIKYWYFGDGCLYFYIKSLLTDRFNTKAQQCNQHLLYHVEDVQSLTWC